MKQAILAVGDIEQGFWFVGPFEDAGVAALFAEEQRFERGDWNVIQLDSPEEAKSHDASAPHAA